MSRKGNSSLNDWESRFLFSASGTAGIQGVGSEGPGRLLSPHLMEDKIDLELAAIHSRTYIPFQIKFCTR